MVIALSAIACGKCLRLFLEVIGCVKNVSSLRKPIARSKVKHNSRLEIISSLTQVLDLLFFLVNTHLSIC